MRLRVCAESGCPELTDQTRCPAHTRQREQQRGSREQRGYGTAHRKLRARWARQVAKGTVACARCGERISILEHWDLDHTDDRAGYLGPSHARCNRNTSHVRYPDRTGGG